MNTESTTDDLAPHRERIRTSIGKNTVLGIVARFAQVGTRFLTIPIVIAHLGLDGYGIWSTVMTITAYMRFGSVGIKSAFQKYVAEATESGNFETTNRLLSTGCAVMLVLSIVGLIPIALFSSHLARATGVPSAFVAATSSCISVMAVVMVLANVGAVFEAIVMGGHRIDTVRTFTTSFTVAEAIAMIVFLRLGYGLVAMAYIMAISEVGYIGCCYLASKRLLPEVRVSKKYVTTDVLRELARFAGSYQLVNVLEVLYVAIVPVAVLKEFGADMAGIFALTTRLVNAAMMLPEAFLQPVLSSGAMVYASGVMEKIGALLATAFKVHLLLSLLPLGFVSIYGAKVIYIWTGQSSTVFNVAVPLVCLAGFLQSFSLLQLVLYRTSGKALLDNVRQVLRIVSLSAALLFAHELGFIGVLIGLTAAEVIGVMFMLFVITRTFASFDGRLLIREVARISSATVLILAAGALSLLIPTPLSVNNRGATALQLAMTGVLCTVAVWPASRVTGAVSSTEWRQMLELLIPNCIMRQIQPKRF